MSLRSCVNIVPVITRTVVSYNKYSHEIKVLLNQSRTIASYVTSSQTRRSYSTEQNKLDVEQTINPGSPNSVYHGLLTPQIRAVKLFSLSSSIIGIIAQPFLYKEIASTGNVPIIVAAYSFIGFFTFVTPILLHLITRKYVTELHYKRNNDTYVAKTINFFCMTKETEFKVDDVKVPDVPGMFTTLIANGKPLFLDPRSFENPEHYAKLMGYDKPIDFKLHENYGEKKE